MGIQIGTLVSIVSFAWLFGVKQGELDFTLRNIQKTLDKQNVVNEEYASKINDQRIEIECLADVLKVKNKCPLQ
jgi:hypothetical protein